MKIIEDFCYSGQEERVELVKKGQENPVLQTRAHARPVGVLNKFMSSVPSVDIQRAYYFTESMKETEGQALILRYAKAMKHIVENITIYIDEGQLIAGAAGGPDRYGILYPEVDGAFYEDVFGNTDLSAENRDAPFNISEKDSEVVRNVIGEYWRGKTYVENYAKQLPEETRKLTYKSEDDLQTRFLISETASWQSSLQWTLDYGKVLTYGMKNIRKQAQEGLANLDSFNPEDISRKKPFYEAVIMTCDALALWANRHAAMAEELAAKESDSKRKEELLEMARICRHVPENPARTFWEAVQAQWFLQCYSRLEAKTATIISNGRMDQYLYPFYKADLEKGTLDDDGVLELLGCLWTNMAKTLELHISIAGVEFSEGYAHWEAVCVGGQTPEGRDATNELTHLFFRSSREFPTHYPDLAARVHSLSPKEFLWDVVETIKEGAGFPKIINDEEVILTLIQQGASRKDALDYTISGCTEVRMINRDTYMTVGSYINYGSMLESVIHNGKIPHYNYEQCFSASGDPVDFATWDDFWAAFVTQHDYFFSQAVMQHYLGNSMYHKFYAAPLSSALHDLCMNDCKDLHEPNITGGINIGFIDCIGFGTLADSLSAIKKLVYEDKKITMAQLMAAIKDNFESAENAVIGNLLANAPAYGNNDPYVDEIAYEIDKLGSSFMERYNKVMGMQLCYRMVPVTSHVPFGKVVGATPNGRKATMPLSDGASAAHARDEHGPTSVLLSNFKTKAVDYKNRTSRLLNIKLTPSCIAGEEGTEKLINFIRTLVDLKLWHIQFNVVNKETLLAAQEDPETYKSLIVRIAGYSAFFCDLSKSLQDDLICRTSCEEIK